MRTLMLWLALLFPIVSWAQSTQETPWLEQGQTQIGLAVGAGWGNQVGGYLRASPYVQYFLKNKWAVRLEGRYNYNGPNGDQYLGAGLTTQYHFLHTNRLSVYGQLGYFYGQNNYKLLVLDQQVLTSNRYLYNYGMLNVGLGAQYQLGSRWSLNALVEKNIGKKAERFPADGHSVNLGIGFRIK